MIFKSTQVADPAEFFIRQTGEFALRFLVLTLLITPLQNMVGANWLVKLRRMVGLYVFYYALLHLAVYVVLYLQFDFAVLLEDIVERKYITVGFMAFVLLLLLAVTSNKQAIKKLGANRWGRLHRSVYVIAVLATIHFLWQVKGKDITEPLIYAALFAVLFILRFPRVKQAVMKKRR